MSNPININSIEVVAKITDSIRKSILSRKADIFYLRDYKKSSPEVVTVNSIMTDKKGIEVKIYIALDLEREELSCIEIELAQIGASITLELSKGDDIYLGQYVYDNLINLVKR